MARNKLLFKYIFIMRFVVLYCMNSCIEDNVLTPNITVGQNNILLVKNESYIDVEVNQTVHLMCEGMEPIAWGLPVYYPDFDSIPDYIKINTTFTGIKYLSELIVEEIQHEDVGYYSCHYNKSLDNFVMNEFNSIYVFVTDLKHLFVQEVKVIAAVNNSAVNISCCKPSSSFTQMSLWAFNTQNSTLLEELYISHENDVSYDPKLGFHIKSMKFEKIRCIARLNGTISQFDIRFQFSPRLESEPIIEKISKTKIFVGDNFTLNCKLTLSKNSKLSLEWSDICIHNWRQRIKFGELMASKLNGSYVINRNITITNAQLSDKGIYKCYTYDFSNNMHEVFEEIKIYDKEESNEISCYSKEDHIMLFILVGILLSMGLLFGRIAN